MNSILNTEDWKGEKVLTKDFIKEIFTEKFKEKVRDEAIEVDSYELYNSYLNAGNPDPPKYLHYEYYADALKDRDETAYDTGYSDFVADILNQDNLYYEDDDTEEWYNKSEVEDLLDTFAQEIFDDVISEIGTALNLN